VSILSKRTENVLSNNEQVVELVDELTDRLSDIELTEKTFRD